MKSIALIIFLASASLASAATAIGNLHDSGADLNHGLVTFTPISTPYANGTNTVTDTVRSTNVPNGLFTMYLLGGQYWVSSPLFKRFKILVPPNDTNTYQLNYLGQLATNLPSIGWTNFTGQISERVFKGSGVTMTTNNAGQANESLTISAAGGGGAVDSVNGQTGTVVLTSGDVGAQPTNANLTAWAALATSAKADASHSHTVAQISNAGTIAYSNAADYVLSPTNSGTDGQVVSKTGDKTKWVTASGTGGSGTVMSVGLSAPGEFTVSGSPVTDSGTLTLNKATQAANKVWAGPTTGADAAPAFRALVAADVPNIAESQVTGLVSDLASKLESPTNNPADGQVVSRTGDKNKWVTPSAGTVTSVGASGPIGFMSWSGSPVTGSGTLTASLATQPGNTFLAGPSDGGDDIPAFRNIVDADINGLSPIFGGVTASSITADSISVSGATIDNFGYGTFNGASLAAGGLAWGSGAGLLGNDGSAQFASGGATISPIGAVTSLTLQSTILAGTGDRLVQADVGGNVSATIDVTSIATLPINLASQVTGSLPIASVATPGAIVTNGGSFAVTQSNSWTWKDGANAFVVVSNGTLRTSSAITGTVIRASSQFSGSGAGLTSVPDSALSANVSLLGSSIDLSGAEATGTLAAGRFPALTGDVTTSAGSLTTALAIQPAVICGNTHNATMAANTTYFFALSGHSDATLPTADTSTYTRNMTTRTVTFTNLYVKLSAGPGASRITTVTLMTNGVASNVTFGIQGAATDGNSGNTSTALIAGQEYGLRIATVTSATAAKATWAIELR